MRSGFFVHAGDLFADADLRQLAETSRVDDYPAGLGGVIDGPQRGGWMYTGALENQPDLVDAWARRRPLWGNPGSVLRAVRDPRRLAAIFARHRIPFPVTHFRAENVPRDGSWLRKPFRSAGGTDIHPWVGLADDLRDAYFQQRIDGASYAGAYLANGTQAILLGVTEQLVGCAWTGASGFRYCGSLGPAALPDQVLHDFRRIGQALAAEFGLRGLFGVDAIVNADGVWPVEVNPRYTASLEVLERALSLAAIALHLDACQSDLLPNEAAFQTRKATYGKAIIYADRRLRVACDWTMRVEPTDGDPWPPVADIPEPGTVFEPGWPIVTVLAAGSDTEAARRLLYERVAQLQAECGAVAPD